MLKLLLRKVLSASFRVLRVARYVWEDCRHNTRQKKPGGTILVIRQGDEPGTDAFLDWVQSHCPEFLNDVRFSRTWIFGSARVSGIRLVVRWVQDPIRERSLPLYWRLRYIEARCRVRNIPVINGCRVLSNAIKSVAVDIVRTTGLRAARAMRIQSTDAFEFIRETVGAPFIVRADQAHTGYHTLVSNQDHYAKVRWDRLAHPVALEYIDTRCDDGYFRKYRYVLIGDTGFPRHLVISKNWFVHAKDRIRGAKYIDEELAYIRSRDPHHDALNAARKALGFDYVAFDYSLDQTGRPVVWEPNPFPVIQADWNNDAYYAYQVEAVDRIFRGLVLYYLERAGLDADVVSRMETV